MKFVMLAALPLVVIVTAPAQAQSLSRAIPPEAETSVSPHVSPTVKTRAQAAVRQVSARASVEPLVPVRGLRASAALPPPASVPHAVPAPTPAPVQVAAASPRATVVEAALRRVSDVRSGGTPRASTRSDVDGDVRCVAQAVFHEARGESLQGQRAVADVVMNRARSGRWGGSACAVVNAPRQFSNRWSWRAPQIGVDAWDRAIAIARDAVGGAIGVSSRLMNFRAASMGAGGGRALRIGNHVFW